MRSRILSIAEVSRAVPELSTIGVFDGRSSGAGREGEAPVIWAAASGNGGAAFGVLLVLLEGFGAFSITFCGVHFEKGTEFIK